VHDSVQFFLFHEKNACFVLDQFAKIRNTEKQNKTNKLKNDQLSYERLKFEFIIVVSACLNNQIIIKILKKNY